MRNEAVQGYLLTRRPELDEHHTLLGLTDRDNHCSEHTEPPELATTIVGLPRRDDELQWFVRRLSCASLCSENEQLFSDLLYHKRGEFAYKDVIYFFY